MDISKAKAKLREKLSERLDWMIDDAIAGVDVNGATLRSKMTPIEALMYVALLSEIVYETGLGSFYGETMTAENIKPQYPIGKYRADFVVTVGKHSVVVECDGHDFHERTKEQAQRDKERDRNMVIDGWQVVRFTGSEIFRDPFKCARQVERFLISRMVGNAPIRSTNA